MSNMWWENNYACIYMPFVKEIGFWKISAGESILLQDGCGRL